MMLELEKAGVTIESASPRGCHRRQAEIDMHYGTLLEMADKVMKYKYVVKNTAPLGKSVTFMPKPLFGDNGSGMRASVIVEGRQEPLLG